MFINMYVKQNPPLTTVWIFYMAVKFIFYSYTVFLLISCKEMLEMYNKVGLSTFHVQRQKLTWISAAPGIITFIENIVRVSLPYY